MADDASAGGGVTPVSDEPLEVHTTVWRRAASTACVESATRVVVLDLDHLDLPPYVFEGSAAQIWACVDGERTESEIVADLARAFDVPVEAVYPDVRNFIDRLAELGLVTSDRNPRAQSS